MAREKLIRKPKHNYNVLVVSDYLHRHNKKPPRQCPCCEALWSALENPGTDEVDVWKNGAPMNDARLDMAGNNVTVECCDLEKPSLAKEVLRKIDSTI